MRVCHVLTLALAAVVAAPPRVVFDVPNGTLEWSTAAVMTADEDGTLFVTVHDMRIVNLTSGVNASVSTDTAGVFERGVARDLEARRYAVPLPRPTSTWTPGPTANLTTTCSAVPGVVVLPPAFTTTAAGPASSGNSRLGVFTAGSTCSPGALQDVVGAALPLFPSAAAWAVGDAAVSGGGLATLMGVSGSSATTGFLTWDTADRRFLLRVAFNNVAFIPTTCPVASFPLAPATDAPQWTAEPNTVPCVGVVSAAVGTPHGSDALHIATAGFSSSDGDSAVFTAEYEVGDAGGVATFTETRKLYMPNVADVAYTSTGQLVLCVDDDAGATGGLYAVPLTTGASETVPSGWRFLAMECTGLVSGWDAASDTHILVASGTDGGVSDPQTLPLAAVLTGEGAGDDTVWTVVQQVPMGAVTARGVSALTTGAQFTVSACNPDWGSATSGVGDVTEPGCRVWSWWGGALRQVGSGPFAPGAVTATLWSADRVTGVVAAHANAPESLDAGGPDWVQLFWLSV